MLDFLFLFFAILFALGGVWVLTFIFTAFVAGLFAFAMGGEWVAVRKWFLKSTWTFLKGFPVVVAGLFIVPIAIPFRIDHPETKKPYTDTRQLPGFWLLSTFPSWAKYYSNEFDGCYGDGRGWWNTYCIENYKKGAEAFYSMFQWLAIRNPANYFSRVITGCDVSKCLVMRIAGKDLADEDNPGWSFLVARDSLTLKEYPLIQFWIPITATHGIWGRFGWKIKMVHNAEVFPWSDDQDRIKASVYRISFWKEK